MIRVPFSSILLCSLGGHQPDFALGCEHLCGGPGEVIRKDWTMNLRLIKDARAHFGIDENKQQVVRRQLFILTGN